MDNINDISVLANKPKSELTQTQLKLLEEHDRQHGPMSLLTQAVRGRTKVLISCRNNHKLLARVKAYDRHCNLLLEQVKEMWTERGKKGKGIKRAKGVNRERFVSKMFLRGDSVILIVFTNTPAIIE